MSNYKNIAFLLLFVLSISIIVPAPAFAAATTGDSGKGALETLVDFLFGDLLNNVLHINLDDLKNSIKNLPLPNLPQKSAGGKEVLGFYAEWWGTDTSSYEALGRNSDAINIIAPYWATLQGDGSVTDRGGNDHAAVVNFAKKNGVSTLLLVNNSKPDNAAEGVHALLGNAATRKAAIANLESYIKKYGLDGVNIDFEMVPAADRDNLTAFIKELSERFKPQGYVVSIDVFPKHNEENDVATAYDYAKLAQYADKIILMTYDYHGAWSGPGSIADIGIIEKDLQYALKHIPKNKIYLGVAGYGYDWSSKGVESLEYKAIEKLISSYNPEIKWDDSAKSPHFSYTGADGIEHQLWYENSKSLKYKIDLVNKYDVAGIALWKLGEEDPASWKVIKENLK